MQEKLIEQFKSVGEIYPPGYIFEIGKVSELPEFEDTVAQRFVTNDMLAEMQEIGWPHRPPLISMIRSNGFRGYLDNFSAEVIDSPYDRIFDVKERGKKYLDGKKGPRKRTAHAEEAERLSQGFILKADIIKNKAVTGNMSIEVYYVPLPEGINMHNAESHTNTGGAVHRYLTQPEFPVQETEVKALVVSHKKVGAASVNACTPNLSWRHFEYGKRR